MLRCSPLATAATVCVSRICALTCLESADSTSGTGLPVIARLIPVATTSPAATTKVAIGMTFRFDNATATPFVHLWIDPLGLNTAARPPVFTGRPTPPPDDRVTIRDI